MIDSEREVLKLLQEWAPSVSRILRKAGYFDLPEGTERDEIARLIGFGPGTPLYRKLKAASLEKNWQVAKIVLTEENLIELKQGAREVAASLGVPFSPYDWNPIGQAYMKAEGFTLVKTLTKTDLKRLVPQIQKHFGLNERTFQKQFANDYPCAPYRMRTIFRTEKNKALNAGHFYQAKAVDANIKIWRHSHGPNPRLDHLAMDGQERKLDDAFSNGEMWPSLPNCRCHVDYKF